MLKLYYFLQQEKLEDYKLNHKAEEEGLEDEIADLEDKLTEVKATLEKRKERLEQVRIQFKKRIVYVIVFLREIIIISMLIAC